MTSPAQPTPAQETCAPMNPFNKDLFAATDSPRFTGGEHRIAFADGSNGVEGHTYGKSLEMAIARADYIVTAVNSHASLVARCARLEKALAKAKWDFELLAGYGLPGDSAEVNVCCMNDIAAAAARDIRWLADESTDNAARAALQGAK